MRRSVRWRCWRWWEWTGVQITDQMSSPADRNSVWQSPAPMINDPAIDRRMSRQALNSRPDAGVVLFHRLHEEQGKTIVLITHSQELATETQRIVTLLDGEIVGDNRGGEH